MSDHFDVNNVTTSGPKGPIESLIGLKDLLVAADGVVTRSSQGFAGTHGVGDNWTSVGVVTRGAWCVITLADGTRQIILRVRDSLLYLDCVSVYVSVDGSYTTVGETEVQPGTTTHYEVLFGPADITGTPTQFFHHDANQVWDAFARSDGSFWFFSWDDGDTRPHTMLSVDVLAYPASGGDDAVYSASYDSTGLDLLDDSPFADAKALMGYVASPYKGTWVSSPAMALRPATGAAFPCTTNRINPHNSKWDILPIMYGIPYNAASDEPIERGSYKGRSSLFGMSSRAAATDYFATLNVSASKDTARIYPMVLLDWLAATDLEY